jgi:hypothetical protein
MIHVFGVYWWYRNDDLLRPLFMLPPKDIPPFWHAIFIIMVNGIANLNLISFSYVWWLNVIYANRNCNFEDSQVIFPPVARFTLYNHAFS